MKPTRKFSADVGEDSTGLRGPDAIESDIDAIMRMFDPGAVHDDLSPGGISGDNFASGSIGTLAIKDEAVTAPKLGLGSVIDSKIGNRTINDSTTAVNTANLTVLLGSLANRIKAILGTGNWKDIPPETLSGMLARLSAADVLVNNAQLATANAVAQSLAAINTANQASVKSDTANTTALSAVNQANLATNIANTATNIANTAADDVAEAITEVNLAIAAAQQAIILAQSYVGNTEINTDVFTIINPNIGNGTFSYDDNGVTKLGVITPEGYQKFTLSHQYFVARNRIKAIINDSLSRSVASGGLIEVGIANALSYEIIVVSQLAANAEITFEYYTQLSLGGKHAMSHNVGSSDALISVGPVEPAETYPGLIWLRVVD